VASCSEEAAMNVGHFLSAAGEQYPERPAFIWGDEIVTYLQANVRAQRLAAALKRLGVVKGDRVGVLMWNCPKMLESFFATWKAGGCVVPLNPRFLESEAAYQLQDSRAKAVIFGEEFREMMAQIYDQTPSVEHLICLGQPLSGQLAFEDLVARQNPAEKPDEQVSDDDLAWLFYTSGTAGRPKGAMLTHGNLSFMALGAVADLMRIEPEDVGLHAAPLTHAAGFLSLAMVLKGSAQVILQPHRFSAELFCAAVAKHRVTTTWLVPTQINLLLKYPDLESWDLSSLKWVIYGGAPMYVAVLKEALKRIGPVFVQLYGLGESPMTVTYMRAPEHVLEGAEARRLASCGRARSGIEIRILATDGQEVPRGEVGEICLRGQSVMKGYWERPEDSAAAIQGGWLYTGDLGYLDENGYLYIVDRTKDVIISGGANIYPREVEEVLVRHPAVAEVSVFGVPDDLWGEAVRAAVVLKPGTTASAEEIIQFAGEHMAGFKKPKAVDFLKELPKSAVGKILKRRLRDPYWAARETKI
jgi:acyl-CoA synthetase (AMP-forming)/AMP-acid ligase II